MAETLDTVKLPAAIRTVAARLAEEDGVTLADWIASAVAHKVGAVESAAEFFRRRAGGTHGDDLLAFLAAVPRSDPDERDALPSER